MDVVNYLLEDYMPSGCWPQAESSDWTDELQELHVPKHIVSVMN